MIYQYDKYTFPLPTSLIDSMQGLVINIIIIYAWSSLLYWLYINTLIHHRTDTLILALRFSHPENA